MAIEFGKKELPPLPSKWEMEEFIRPVKERFKNKEKISRGLESLSNVLTGLRTAEQNGALDTALKDYARCIIYAPPEAQESFSLAQAGMHEEILEERASPVAKIANSYLKEIEITCGEEDKLLTKLGFTPQDKENLFRLHDMVNCYMNMEGALSPEDAAEVMRENARKLFPNMTEDDFNRCVESDDRLKFYFRPEPNAKSGSPTRMHKIVKAAEAEEAEEKQVSLLRKPANYQIRWKEMPAEEVAKILDWEIQQEYKELAKKEKSGNQ